MKGEMSRRVLKVSQLENDRDLAGKLKEYKIGLTAPEVRKIARILGRDPTLVELHIFNVEWSEHCSYKSSKAVLEEFLPTQAPNVIQGPEEDAGIIYLTRIKGERYGLVIAHESHNHPSQVLPNEGAATGIGGIVRDVDCMGAKVIAVSDPLRFGDPRGECKERTKWIANGVVAGIWEYGNALGVPNLGGDVVWAGTYDDNCLVNVIALGVLKEKEIIHSRVPPEALKEDYEVILVGKPTDSSGFGGAAFASEILDEEKETRGAVQVPDPFLKNVLFKANNEIKRRAREKGYKIGFKDLGGAGFACASSEIGASGGFGLEINLDDVHQALPDLLPEVISCAETQERYILVVPRSFVSEVLKVYNEDWDLPNVYQGAKASIVGKVRKDKEYILRHRGEIVCRASIREIARGIRYKREAKPRKLNLEEPKFPRPEDLNEVLLKLLRSPNISSKEYIYRFYDTEVQGNALVRPGEADAGVIAPLPGSRVGVALATDGNPFYGRIDPYWGGATAVAEAMRNVAAVGAVPSGLTDCLNYGNPEKPEAFHEFREGVRGISDAARNIWLKGHKNTPVPVVSGNVSFYNESAAGRAIDPSPIIACLGILRDYSKAITMQFKEKENLVYLVGERYDELGGSDYYREVIGALGKNVPLVRFEEERNNIYAVIDSINAGLAKACHDISNGGMIVTIAEMMMGGRANGHLGAEINLDAIPGDIRKDKKLFSESSGFILEVRPRCKEKIEKIFRKYKVKAFPIGEVASFPSLIVRSKGKDIIHLPLSGMKKSWTRGTAEAMR
jgi:phosphoribosylformylglycinamidine synthase